jgi:hypothetical protein
MSSTIILNKADVQELLKVLDEFKIDSFKLIKHDTSGIGYTLDIEYSHKLNDRMVETRISVVGTDNW